MISLERLVDGSPAARNFDALQSLVIDTGGQSVGARFGSGTLTFPGSSDSTGELTVTHGLATTPVAVLVTGTGGTTLVTVNDVGGTTFDALGVTTDGSEPAADTESTFYWLAIG